MQLSVWIKKSGGDSAIAKKLGIARQTVRGWRLGDFRPKPHHAMALYKLAQGDLHPFEAMGLPLGPLLDATQDLLKKKVRK